MLGVLKMVFFIIISKIFEFVKLAHISLLLRRSGRIKIFRLAQVSGKFAYSKKSGKRTEKSHMEDLNTRFGAHALVRAPLNIISLHNNSTSIYFQFYFQLLPETGVRSPPQQKSELLFAYIFIISLYILIFYLHNTF